MDTKIRHNRPKHFESLHLTWHLEYLHDNCQKVRLKVTPLGSKDGFYRVELGFTDSTDYARLLNFPLEQLHLGGLSA